MYIAQGWMTLLGEITCLLLSLLSTQLSKSAQEAASKVKEQSEEIGKTKAFKTVSTVSMYAN